MSSSYTIEVKWNKETFHVDVCSDMYCEHLGVLLQQKTGVPTSRQKIMGASLKPGCTLEQCKVTRNKKLLLVGTSESLVINEEKEDTSLDSVSKAGQQASMGFSGHGLVNLGNTCYLNSAIHFLRQVRPLFSYFQSNVNQRRSNTQANVVTSLGQLMNDVESVDPARPPINPMLFLMLFRSTYPQFAAMDEGHPMQQDAQEALMTMLQSIQQHMQSPEDVDFYYNLFCIQYDRTLKCTESEHEAPTRSTESILMLPCHIDTDTTTIEHGLKQGMTGVVEKFSSTLNRDAAWSITQEINHLPEYLIIHMVRFRWNKASGQKAKVLKPVSFPFTLDVYSLCSNNLKKKLEPYRDHLKKEQDRELELQRQQKVRMNESTTSETNITPVQEESMAFPAMENVTGYYELCACVSHKGRDANGGHYISWVKDNISDVDRWIVYDDENSGYVKPEDVQRLRGVGEAHIAYVLLYRTRHPLTYKIARPY